MQMRRHGNHGWDGYTYFINKNAIFPTGFLPMVLEYLKDLGVHIVLEDKRDNMPMFKAGDYNFESPKGTLADHQQQLIIKTKNYLSSVTKTHIWNLYFPRGIWDAATNARKTASAGNLLLNLEDARAIMLVNDQKLLKQHYEYYKTVFTGHGELGYITSSKEKPGSKLVIAMVRTLHNRMKKSMTVQRNMHDRYNVLIVDEGHDFGGRESTFVINKINAGMRLLMSGTPLSGSDKITKFRLIGMFGSVLHTVTKRYLMDCGFSLKPKVKIYRNPTIARALTYQQEMQQVILESEELAELVADIVCKYRKKKVLIVYYEHKHGELLYNTFCERYPTLAHMAEVVHGEDKQKLEKIDAYLNNEKTILFSSTILQQGINIPDIEVGINCIGEKSAVTLSQFMGRLERVDGVNTHFIWCDFWHNGNWMSKHSKKRIALYKKEDFPDEIKFMYNNRRGVPIK